MERTAVKNIQREREREPKAAPQSSKFVNIDTEYSDNEKTELVVKKTRKSSEDTDDKEEEPAVRSPEDSDVEDTLRAIQEEEEPVFKKGDTKGQKISLYFNTDNLKLMLRPSVVIKTQTKEAIKIF